MLLSSLFLNATRNKNKNKYMKQVILVRQDLKLPKGKMAAQVAHAAVECVLKSDSEKVASWKQGGMKKSVLKVKDLKELRKYSAKARRAKLKKAMIKDAGRTFFKRATITCLGIGPGEDETIDKITGGLKLV